ncbi:MAG: OmpA family protein [Alphaproteobacteria bacterium]|nr:OmpA family protein [Alphaproteobacteria bacterium]
MGAERRRDRRRRRTAPSRRAQDQELDSVRANRRRRRTEGGGSIVQEPDGRSIVRRGRRTIIRSRDSNRIRRQARSARSALRRDGGRVTTVTRRNGVKIISVFDRDGRLLRRIRRGPRGRNVVLFDNRPVRGHRRRAAGFPFLLELAAPIISIPLANYIIDTQYARYDDIYTALDAPPVDDVDAAYSLDEIRYNHALRARMRRVDINTINFDFGSWYIDDDEIDKLSDIARALKRILRDSPDEIFLIEGHTDAVGSPEDNLSLSDRRAESVAIILSEEFSIPPENLTTQGYGEQFLRVDSYGPERRNRRVSIRRITPMLNRGRDKYADIDPGPTEYQPEPLDRDRLFEFISDRYLVSYDLTSAEMRDLYAYEVDHYGKRRVPISNVIRDKQNYYRRWPDRKYEIDQDTFRVEPGNQPGLYDVSFEYSFDVRGGSRRSRGRGVTELTLRETGPAFTIESEGGKVLERF